LEKESLRFEEGFSAYKARKVNRNQ